MLLKYDEVKMYAVIFLYKYGCMTVIHGEMFHISSSHATIALSTAVEKQVSCFLKIYLDSEFLSHR